MVVGAVDGRDRVHALVDLAEQRLVLGHPPLPGLHGDRLRGPLGLRRLRHGASLRVPPSAARARAASPSCRSTAPGVFIRASLPSPSTSCTGIIASAARDDSASSISSHGSRVGKVAARACRCRGSTCRRPGGRGGSRAGAGSSAGPWNAQRSTTMPGKPSASRSALDVRRDHAEVLGDHRQRAELGLGGAEDRGSPGPRRQRPSRAVRLRRRHRPVGGEAAEVVDPGEVDELEASGAAARSTSGSPRRASASQS